MLCCIIYKIFLFLLLYIYLWIDEDSTLQSVVLALKIKFSSRRSNLFTHCELFQRNLTKKLQENRRWNSTICAWKLLWLNLLFRWNYACDCVKRHSTFVDLEYYIEIDRNFARNRETTPNFTPERSRSGSPAYIIISKVTII